MENPFLLASVGLTICLPLLPLLLVLPLLLPLLPLFLILFFSDEARTQGLMRTRQALPLSLTCRGQAILPTVTSLDPLPPPPQNTIYI